MTNDLPLSAGARLGERVSAALEQRILQGAWPPGSRLPSEASLCEQLGVSRTVVRDAIQLLAARGLVAARPGVGTLVLEPSDAAYSDALFLLLVRSDATIGDALEARMAVELGVVGVAADAPQADGVATLQHALADLEQAAAARDWRRALDADLRLHLSILEATRLPVLIALLRPMQRIIPATSYPPDFDCEQDFEVERHAQLVEAVASGDAEAARRAMRRHFDFLGDPRYSDLHARPFCEAPLIRAQLDRRARAA